jgi:hypothetical protein
MGDKAVSEERATLHSGPRPRCAGAPARGDAGPARAGRRALAGTPLLILLVWPWIFGAPAPEPQPSPEMAPPPATALGLGSASAGWFAQRDPRTGELVADPRELPRLALESRARPTAALVERRLPNGAYAIDLPPEGSTPLYGWIDEDGALHSGHQPPPWVRGATPAARVQPPGAEP